MRARRRAFVSVVAAFVVLATVMLASPAARAAQAKASCDGATALSATFLQLTRTAALRPRADWERLFDDLARVAVREVFVQWTLADGVAFYARHPAAPDDVAILDLLLELAERHGMRLWLGLAHDAGWWAGIDRARPATDVEVFLARRRLANLEVARALAPQVAGRASFAGWYVPDEIDDKNWLGADRSRLVVDYLRDLGASLAVLAPGVPFAASGFAQGWATPQQVVALWSEILDRSMLALPLFQDGVGAGKLTLDELPYYLPALRTAADARGRPLGVVVELFTAGTAEASGGTEAFVATPAPLARIERQIALASRWASGPVVGFSLPDYMSDFGGVAATRAYDAYRRWVDGCQPAARR
jgi:hypothetical protein